MRESPHPPEPPVAKTETVSIEYSKRMNQSHFKLRPIHTFAATAALALPTLYLSLRAKRQDQATQQILPLPPLPTPAQPGRESG